MYDRTPLADYLKGTSLSIALGQIKTRHYLAHTNSSMADEGDEEHEHWGTAAESGSAHDESPPSSPTFAPVGRPMVKKRFRTQRPDPLHLETSPSGRISSLHNKYSVCPLSQPLDEERTWLTFAISKPSPRLSTVPTTRSSWNNSDIPLLLPNYSMGSPSLASNICSTTRARRGRSRT